MTATRKTLPTWVFLSLVSNGILLLAVSILISRQQGFSTLLGKQAYSQAALTQPPVVAPELGRRHKLSYEKWVDILKQEAKVVEEKKPKNLTILAGDSLSLWFPPELLPPDRNWLNQGISGETSNGLLKRLYIFDKTKPQTILLMIGINDLIRGVSDREIINNHREIMGYLRKTHPQSQIILQSILPHSTENVTWEGKDKLLAIANSRIRKLNQQLQTIAGNLGVKFLDLQPAFTDPEGNLKRELSSDGLHLSPKGYLVWRTAIQMYSQIGQK